MTRRVSQSPGRVLLAESPIVNGHNGSSSSSSSSAGRRPSALRHAVRISEMLTWFGSLKLRNVIGKWNQNNSRAGTHACVRTPSLRLAGNESLSFAIYGNIQADMTLRVNSLLRGYEPTPGTNFNAACYKSCWPPRLSQEIGCRHRCPNASCAKPQRGKQHHGPWHDAQNHRTSYFKKNKCSNIATGPCLGRFEA